VKIQSRYVLSGKNLDLTINVESHSSNQELSSGFKYIYLKYPLTILLKSIFPEIPEIQNVIPISFLELSKNSGSCIIINYYYVVFISLPNKLLGVFENILNIVYKII